MHVISASRRTDIPAFYSQWFMNRIRAGSCLVANPFSGRIHRVSLNPAEVIALLFWTRNPAPLLPHLDELERRGFRCAFEVTLTGYGRDLDRDGPAPERVIELIRRLAGRIGPEFIHWRYDPIILTGQMTADDHRRRFARLCAALAGNVRGCRISFLQLYRKNRARVEQAAEQGGYTYGYIPVGSVAPPRRGRELSVEERRELADALGEIAASHGIPVQSCCSELLVNPLSNVHQAHCVDRNVITALRPDLELDLKPKPTRAGCGCYASIDIGAYDTCAHACAYCYATRDPAVARAYLRRHDPNADMLGA
ncbi:MAG TPA: DUF1848 domain-containing protein [Armatimonadota bacterium]|nr:DUF1848 domain-containing protein [Armatimonadota bacterium]HPO71496.1 DUF1848 domain-containing protein [Armatimonadota bacterium]